jgi:hypothetical protein
MFKNSDQADQSVYYDLFKRKKTTLVTESMIGTVERRHAIR